MRHINPLTELSTKELLSVQVPSRYLGGEYGATIKPYTPNEEMYNVAVAFPDLYEIGMSNLAIKIIYNALNAQADVRAELVFAPDVDFEALLRKKNIPLYTLETGMALKDVDLVAFSIGYELGATEVLAMLETGGIPPLRKDRGPECPIIIAGGCGTTNPAPISDFFDAIMIGEAEDGLFDLVKELSALKKRGAHRAEALSLIESKQFMWTSSKKSAVRAVQANFGLVPSVPAWFPQPVVKPIQDHGVVEIMRGCPNGCRFCHAGIYYRPMRVKAVPLIIEEIDHLVFDAGYREISLNSLSSADFPDISGLLDTLYERYKGYNVSFQLPSLKVNSFSLPVLEKLSRVRRSGLTFAIETPEEAWQLSLNKEVYAQHLEEIIREAKKKGWSSAKFYFMIGLPLGSYFSPESKTEEEAIVAFLLDLQQRTHIQCNVNVGVFIPKPHTAYQWVTQLTPEEAKRKIDYIYEHLPKGKFKLGKHNYNTTVLEGLLSRGDKRTGSIIFSAYKKGARFDAWDDHLEKNMDYWNSAFLESGWNVADYIYKQWNISEPLPWDSVSLGPPKGFFKKEWQNSLNHLLTAPCNAECTNRCGICSPQGPRTAKNVSVHTTEELEKISHSIKNNTVTTPKTYPASNIAILYRVVFYFTRCAGAEFTAYLSQVEMFHKAILRSSLPFVFSSGFNPLPRIEFASAMTLGIPSKEEVASCLLYENMEASTFIDIMNNFLPTNFKITDALIFPVTNLRKREPLSQSLWGGVYEYSFLCSAAQRDTFLKTTHHIIPQSATITLALPTSDKAFRTSIEDYFDAKWFEIVSVTKTHTLAKPKISGWTANDEENWRHNSDHFKKEETISLRTDESPISFLELYKKIASINSELIQKQQTLQKERDAFYTIHPDILQKHQQNGHISKIKAN